MVTTVSFSSYSHVQLANAATSYEHCPVHDVMLQSPLYNTNSQLTPTFLLNTAAKWPTASTPQLCCNDIAIFRQIWHCPPVIFLHTFSLQCPKQRAVCGESTFITLWEGVIDHLCPTISERFRKPDWKLLVIATNPFYMTHMWGLRAWIKRQIFMSNNNVLLLKQSRGQECLPGISLFWCEGSSVP